MSNDEGSITEATAAEPDESQKKSAAPEAQEATA